MSLLAKQSSTDMPHSESSRASTVLDEMERMFENFSPTNWGRPFHFNFPRSSELSMSLDTSIPKVDVIERDGEIVIKAMMPGVDKKDVDISMTKNTITISGKTSHEEKEEKGNYYRCEISKGSYLRTLTLPENVDEDRAKATFKNGMLELTIPKLEVSHRRNIKVE